MGGGNGKSKKVDLYVVLGVSKECSALELRDAYKKLALRWHPDRCSAAGNLKSVDESKKKFQAIQHAYSVLSDANKRFMYDIGAYDSDDDEDDQNGMGDFLNEMAVMMSQTKPCEDGDESLEELQDLFDEMFQGDIDAYASKPYRSLDPGMCSLFSSSSSSYGTYQAGTSSSNKRSSSEMSRGISSAHGSSGFDGRWTRGNVSSRKEGEQKEERPEPAAITSEALGKLTQMENDNDDSPIGPFKQKAKSWEKDPSN